MVRTGMVTTPPNKSESPPSPRDSISIESPSTTRRNQSTDPKIIAMRQGEHGALSYPVGSITVSPYHTAPVHSKVESVSIINGSNMIPVNAEDLKAGVKEWLAEKGRSQRENSVSLNGSSLNIYILDKHSVEEAKKFIGSASVHCPTGRRCVIACDDESYAALTGENKSHKIFEVVKLDELGNIKDLLDRVEGSF